MSEGASPLGNVIRRMARSRARGVLLEAGPPGHKLADHPPLRGPSTHGLHELGICYEGEMLVASGAKIHRLRAGDFVVIEPGAWHYESYRKRRGPYKACWLCIAPGASRCNFTSYGRGGFSTFWLRGLSTGAAHDRLFRQLLREIRARREGRPDRMHRLLLSLLADFRLCTEGIAQPPGHLAFEPLDKLLQIMEVRFREPLEIRALAREVGLTPNYLSSRFKQTFHTGFTHYLQVLRAWHAQLLLMEGLPIKAVAAECGFKNVHYFTAVFTRKCGITPGAYVRSLRARGRAPG